MLRDKMKKTKKDGGFSIIEVAVATGIVAITFMAIMTLFANNLSMEISNRNRIIASYLAQEGIEVVKQKRDSNWFSGSNWLNEIPDGDLFFSMKDQDDIMKGWIFSSDSRAEKVYLHNGTYVQSKSNKKPSDWTETGFTRSISIDSHTSSNRIKVTVHVGYNGEKSSAEVTSYLYNGWFK